ncbi:UNVERIFIED_CONTAM: hypothetical protein Sradi_3985200 [Sesamum radiatum]|uniref:Transposase-associated domain-containing protein n=1 Tax=Sesamum radiatum TaxID=300843 RepID=A0AAW2PK02_SESRA
MYEKNLPGNIGIRKEFADGVTEFINWAKSQFAFMDGEKICCPCSNCRNNKFKSTEEVTYDLYRKGFLKNYYNWISHGKPLQMDYEHPILANNFIDQMTNWSNYEQLNWDQRMVFDAAGPVFRPHGNAYNDSHTNEVGSNSNDGVQHNIDNSEALSEKIFDVVRALDQPLYNGSEIHSQLSAVARLVNMKSEYNVSQSCHDQYLQMLYASNTTVEHMSWHATHETESKVMCHPSDAEA